MADTVVVTAPDAAVAVLAPTLTDAITAAQLYASQCAASQAIVLAAQLSVNNSTTTAINSMLSAISAATTAAANAAALVLPSINSGTTVMATRSRLKRALNNAGNLQTVEDYFMNTYPQYGDASLSWKEGVFLPTGGFVYVGIKAALSFTDPQMISLWAAALALMD